MKFKDMQTFSFPGELTYMMPDFDLKKIYKQKDVQYVQKRSCILVQM